MICLIPSLIGTPFISSARWSDPSSFRHFSLVLKISLKVMASAVLRLTPSCGLGLNPGLGHPDIVQPALGPGLQALGHLVQHVGGLVDPAALRAGLAIDLAERLPETQCAVADRQFGAGPQAPVFEVQLCALSR